MTTPFRWTCLLFVLSITSLSASGMAVSYADVPATHNLDLRQVRLVIEASPEFTARFYDRTMNLFEKAGLHLLSPDQPLSPPAATLKLTLNPTPLGNTCPGNVLYEPSFALIEPVIVPRNSEVMHDITWSSNTAPQVRVPVAVEELETDLDGHVHRFITTYKLGNPGWQSEESRHARKASESPRIDQRQANPIVSEVPDARVGVSLNGLDADTLQLSVLAGRLSKTLATRALHQLTNAGLPVSLNERGNDAAILSLELSQRSVEVQCPGMILYGPGLFLVEQVRVKRNPQILIWSDTWVRENLQVIPPLSVEQLESAQDALLKQFIHSFQTK
jgi:hypothetical protein